ncbi:MAG TPA: hypothetical protein VFP93_04050 [Gammaproteobacteria bacterium]|nr:hypothetical protein [Gammaproteobacteria bacterium]
MSQQGPHPKKHKSNAHEQKISIVSRWYIKFQGADNYLIENIGDLECIEKALECGANVNPKSPDAVSPLLQAIAKNAPVSVKKLIKAGADVNLPGKVLLAESYSNSTLPIMKALELGNAKIVYYLLRSKAKLDFTYAIKNAVVQGNNPVLEILIQSIAHEEAVLLVNKLTPALEFALNKKKLQALCLLMQYYPCKEQFVQKALTTGNKELLTTLVDLNIDLNQPVYFSQFNETLTPFDFLLRNKDAEMLDFLLELNVALLDYDKESLVDLYASLNDSQKTGYFKKLIVPFLKNLEIDGELKLPVLPFLNINNCIHLSKELLLLLLNNPTEFINMHSKSELHHLFVPARLKAREILHASQAIDRERVRMQNALANNNESAMHDDNKLFTHYSRTIKPHYQSEFLRRGGVAFIEAEIRGLLLRRILANGILPDFGKEIIRQNLDILVSGEEKEAMDLIRPLLNSNTDSNQVAWRLYDKWAPFIGERNFMTEEPSGFGTNVREMIAYYFIGVMDVNMQPECKEDRVANFILQLSEIRRGNNKDNPSEPMDVISCLTGYRSRIGQMGILHPILSLPELPLEEIMKNLVAAKFHEYLRTIPAYDDKARELLFNALVMLQESNAQETISGEVFYSDEMLNVREAFIVDALGDRFNDIYREVEKQLISYMHGEDFMREMERPINQLKLQLYRLDVSRGTIGDRLTELYNPYRERAITIEKIEALLKHILLNGVHKPHLRPIIYNFLDVEQKTSEVFVDFFREVLENSNFIDDDIKKMHQIYLNNKDLLKALRPICQENLDYLKNYSNRYLGSQDFLMTSLQDVFVKRKLQMAHYPEELKKTQIHKMNRQQERCIRVAESLCGECPNDLLKYQYLNLKNVIVDFIEYTTNQAIDELDEKFWNDFKTKHPIINQLGEDAITNFTTEKPRFKRAYF